MLPPLPAVKRPSMPPCPAPRLSGLAVFMLGLLAMPGVQAADPPPGPPPARPEEHGGKGPRGPGNGGGGNRFDFGGRKGDDMDQLSEDEKHRLRAALEKVWSRPEVSAARERVIKANEDFRSTLRDTLQKDDPDVVKILEKVKTPMPWEQHRGPPPMPRADDPNFPRLALHRLGFEMMTFARPEQRQAFRHLHERVIEMPAVKEAIQKVQSTPPEGRIEAFKTLRDVYRKECEQQIAEFRRKRAAEGRPGEVQNLAAPK